MNKKYIQYNLEEAKEEIENILYYLKHHEDYSHHDLYSSMQHLIHHVNIIWNARNTTQEEVAYATEEDLERWGKFPTDIQLI